MHGLGREGFSCVLIVPFLRIGGALLSIGNSIVSIRFADLKAYLRNYISPFAECISEKLLTYATGRPMSYSDHKLIRQIVEENHNQEGGFQDLLLALVNSESFRTR